MATGHRYFMIHKPAGMESQFIANFPGKLLGDLDFDFPEGIHALGRLDKPSEGLLLLTTNTKMTRLLFQGKEPHWRRYLVQVRQIVEPEALQKLQQGVSIRVKGGGFYTTPGCDVTIVEDPQKFLATPIEIHPHIRNTWLMISLQEGKFRQVRKMVAAVGHRCMRLIRISIDDISLGDLMPRGIRELSEPEFFEKLNLPLPATPA